MTPSQSLVRLGGVVVLAAALSACAGPRILTSLSPETLKLAPGGVALLPGAPGPSPVGDLVGARLASRAPKAGQGPDYYVVAAQSARVGKIGVMGSTPTGAPPAWVEAPRKSGWRFWTGDKPVRTVSLTVLDARTGKKLADATAADGHAGDRQPLSALVDAALARAGLITP
ncbi:hypothetical protein [Phenylobacterium aquaticum]|uniref:hypothetical protein n=1 Tax=Phenylobacterium aquaticum TaxID=1763816 RepID=UPI0026EE5F73|nr:hypothetical protein [Phenylobacterium aquaticum]